MGVRTAHHPTCVLPTGVYAPNCKTLYDRKRGDEVAPPVASSPFALKDTMTKVHTTKPDACPYCGHKFNRQAGVETNDKPKAGDVSLCIKCGGVLIFNKKLRMRRPTAKELKEVAGLPDTQRAIAAWRRAFGKASQ